VVTVISCGRYDVLVTFTEHLKSCKVQYMYEEHEQGTYIRQGNIKHMYLLCPHIDSCVRDVLYLDG
jgi:hypothetical protein